MNPVKRFFLNTYKNIEARKELYHLRDRRAWSPILSDTLIQAARTWPKAFPERWKPDTIIDVGANCGNISRQFAELYRPNFIAMVEPLPEMRARLENMKLAKSQKVFSCALGSKPGTAFLNVLSNSPSSSLLEPRADLGSFYQVDMIKEKEVAVKLRTLDDIFGECKIEDVDLLKVDVEGYEIKVFKGGGETLRHTKLIVCEVVFFEAHKGRPLFEDVYGFLRKSEFELRETIGFVYDAKGLPLQCDAVFENMANCE